MATVSEFSILSAKEKEIAPINASIGNADASMVEAYRSLVSIIDSERIALVDEATNRLRPGTHKAIATLAPNVDKSYLSTAWSAFCADAGAFASATSLRQLRDIASDAAEKKSNGASEASKAMKALTSALERASKAGMKTEAILAIVEAALAI